MNVVLFLLFIFLGGQVGGLLVFFTNRLPDRNTIFFDRFRCQYCNHRFKFLESIPILSYAIQKGKCKNCGKKLNLQCFMMEIINSILYGLLFYLFGLSWNFIYFSMLSSAMLLISFIDLKYFEIPIYCQIFFGFFTVLYIIVNPIDPLLAIFFGLVYYIIIKLIKFITEKITKVVALGDGDILLIALCGSVLGSSKILLFFTSVSILGILFGIIWKYAKKEDIFPFALPILLVYFSILTRLVLI